MNLLRRELAPISPKGWKEIDAMARETLVANLSARKFVDLDGPHGITHACVPLGRLDVGQRQKAEDVRYGVHQLLPLVEARTSFVLKQWELDNLERGAKDIELTSLVEAARKMARFEETAVYQGFDPGCIRGIHANVQSPLLPLALDGDAVVDAVSEGQARLLREGVEGACHLVVSPELWTFLARSTPGGTLRAILEKQIGGHVIYSGTVQGALLVAARGGDLELTVGQDFAIGYHHHTSEEVSLFMSESFTFRVIVPEALVGFEVKGRKGKK